MVIDGQEDPLIRRRDYRVEISATIILIEMHLIMKFPALDKVHIKNVLWSCAIYRPWYEVADKQYII